MYVDIYIYIYIYKFTNKCHSQTTPSWSRGSRRQGMFLAPSADNRCCKIYTYIYGG